MYTFVTHRVAFKQAPGAQADALALKALDVVCDDGEAVFVVGLCTRMIAWIGLGIKMVIDETLLSKNAAMDEFLMMKANTSAR